MGRLFTRYSPVRHSLKPEGLSSFDLHVLSMPPAFILSQNQTLEFNCLKPLLSLKSVTTTLTNFFVISLLTLLSRFFASLARNEGFEKINGNYISFALLLQIISHFFLILFLIFFERAFRLVATPSRRQLVYHTTNYLSLSTVFSIFF